MRTQDAPPERGGIEASYIRHYTKPEETNRILSHPYSELMIINHGDVKYASGGRVVRLGDKSVIYNRSGVIHNNFVQESRIYERYRIKFYGEDLSPEDAAGEIEKALLESYTKELCDGDFQLIWELARATQRACAAGDAILRRKALAMLVLCAARGEDRATLYGRSYISDVIDYIDMHLGDRLTLDGIADAFFISRTKLIYDFTAYTGVTVNEYITMARLERAKELLGKGYTVSSTALECGFSTPSYFIKVFSTVVGTTPLRYQLARVKKH